jgi:hypothetical protein
MTFKPALWKPIAFVLSAINLVAVGLAAGAAEPWHAAGHAGLALGFGLWAQRLGQRRIPGAGGAEVEVQDRLEGIEAEVSDLRRELSEAQERLDFTERVLAQRPESRQVGP